MLHLIVSLCLYMSTLAAKYNSCPSDQTELRWFSLGWPAGVCGGSADLQVLDPGGRAETRADILIGEQVGNRSGRKGLPNLRDLIVKEPVE